jgi:hypothetical protein
VHGRHPHSPSRPNLPGWTHLPSPPDLGEVGEKSGLAPMLFS